ncbi:MAG: hypothetical protein LBV26_00820 [Bacteroidales bacterium]|jgi:hypothetical protein|nr:hypothetical protein [Bacteroidales bacterium]
MKKVNFFMVAAFVAAGCVFSSCKKDEPAKPVITVNLDGTDRTEITIEQGASVKVKIDYTAEAGIKQIDLEQTGGSNLEGYPKTKDFVSSNVDKAEFTVGPLTEAGTVKLVTRLTDKDANTTNKEIVITVNKAKEPTAGEINTFANVLIGCLANNTTAGSSCASIDGKVYNLAAAKPLSAQIDFIYLDGATNPLSIVAPNNTVLNGLSAASADRVATWAKRNATKLGKLDVTAAAFDAMGNDAVIAEKVTTTAVAADIVKDLKAGDVVGFITEGGKKGMLKVINTVTTPAGSKSITIAIKVQK